MFRDGWGFMMRKYMDDAKKLMASDRDRILQVRQQRAAAQQRILILKRCLLGLALVGAAAGLFYAHELGGMVATNVSRRQFAAPVTEAAPPSKAKLLRKLAESHRQREEDLAEIENF